MQKWLKVAEDGQVGARTIKALQKKVGAKVDGIWGKETTKKLQSYLTKQGYKTTANGDFGTVTIKHLQQFLNKYFKEKKD